MSPFNEAYLFAESLAPNAYLISLDPLLTWSGDMRIAVVFSKQKAAEAAAKMRPALFLCVNIPKSALFRSGDECGRFFDEG